MKLKLTGDNIVACVLYLTIGILLCVLQMRVLEILFTLVGALLILYGIYDIVEKRVTRGAIEATIGIVVIVCGWTIVDWAIFVLGILMIVKGVIDLLASLSDKKNSQAMLNAIVLIVIGALLVTAKWVAVEIGNILCIVIGALFIVNGVLALFGRQLSK